MWVEQREVCLVSSRKERAGSPQSRHVPALADVGVWRSNGKGRATRNHRTHRLAPCERFMAWPSTDKAIRIGAPMTNGFLPCGSREAAAGNSPVREGAGTMSPPIPFQGPMQIRADNGVEVPVLRT